MSPSPTGFRGSGLGAFSALEPGLGHVRFDEARRSQQRRSLLTLVPVGGALLILCVTARLAVVAEADCVFLQSQTGMTGAICRRT